MTKVFDMKDDFKVIKKDGFYVVKPSYKQLDKRCESLHAIDFYNFAIHKNPDLVYSLFHVTNEGLRSWSKGKELKQSGLIKGVADYILLKPSNGYNFAAIELKRENGGSISKEQKEFLCKSTSNGGFSCVCFGYKAALFTLEFYFGNIKGKFN
jgi:hypothetical protein